MSTLPCQRRRVVQDEKKQNIKLRLVNLAKVPATTKDGEPTDDYTGDTFLLVDSHAKAMKEQSMADREEALYVDGLNAIKEGLAKKGGTKKRDKVNERLGRLNARTAPPTSIMMSSWSTMATQPPASPGIGRMSRLSRNRSSTANTSYAPTSRNKTKKPSGTSTISSATWRQCSGY